MIKLISLFLLVLSFAYTSLADPDVPLPGPGAPPSEPPAPQPTPPPSPTPPSPTPPPPDSPSPKPTPKPRQSPRKPPRRTPKVPAPTPTPDPDQDLTPTPTPWPSETPTPSPIPPQESKKTYTVGVGQVARFKDRVFNFFIPAHRSSIRALRITCTRQEIKIKNVTVQFTNGQRSDQFFLVGPLNFGESRVTYMPGEAVFKITVVASSSSIFKGKGAFRLDATAILLRRRNEGKEEPHQIESPLLDENKETPY